MTEERVTYTTQLEARIAELEHENRRLRFIYGIPTDVLRRYIDRTERTRDEDDERRYSVDDFIADRDLLDGWVSMLEGQPDAEQELHSRIAELEAALADRDARIAELEKQSANLGHIVIERNADVAQLQKQLNEAGQIVRACESERRALAATIARLEQDNRRLRHLDSMPLDAMRRLVENCEWTLSEDYTAEQYVSDYGAAMAHFRKTDGAA